MKPIAALYFTLFLLALASTPPAHAQETPRAVGRLSVRQRQQAALYKAQGVIVNVPTLSPEAQAAGLKPSTLEADAVAALKKAGIPVYRNASEVGGKDAVQLVLAPKVRAQSNFFVVIVQAEGFRNVVVGRTEGNTGTPGVRVALPVWRNLASGVLTKASLPTLKTRVGEAVSVFIADYKAANKR